MPVGRIVDFRGDWSSGMATLVLEVKGRRVAVHCENGPTVRALEAIFGGVIVPSHSVDVGALRGKKIQYEVDEWGVLGSIGPVPEVSRE